VTRRQDVFPTERRELRRAEGKVRRRASEVLAASVPLLLGGLFLAGCGLLKRADVSTYTLAVQPGTEHAVATGDLPVGIGTVELPPGVDRREIVVHVGDQRLEVRGTELWSAPFESLVLHTLAFGLAQRLPAGTVVLPGQVQPEGGQRSLDLVFAELAAGPEAVLVVDVHWTLRATAAGPPERAGHERLEEPLGSLDSAAIAAGTSRALAALADRLAAAVAAPSSAPAG
jgi:uncharacterized lipoprotein YmbA